MTEFESSEVQDDAEEAEKARMAKFAEAKEARAASKVWVKRTANGSHPISAAGRVWDAGDIGEISGGEADPRIEQGLFEETDDRPPKS